MSEPVKFTLDEFVASLGDPHHPAVIEYMALRARIAVLEAVAEATAEWFGPSLQDARFETVAVIKALREAGYSGTT